MATKFHPATKKPNLSKVGHVKSLQGEQQEGVTSTEEIIQHPDGSTRRIIRTTTRTVVEQPPTLKRAVTIGSVSSQTRPAQAQNNITVRTSTASSRSLNKTPSVDIPFADEAPGDLDVPFDLEPSSHNTPSLIRSASVKRIRKAYSVTDASDEYAPAMKSPQPKVMQNPSRQPITSWARLETREERKPRPHSFHGRSAYHRSGSYGNSGYSSIASSANSSFVMEEDLDVFSMEFAPNQNSTPRNYSSPGRSPSENGNKHVNRYPSEAPVTRSQSFMLKAVNSPSITITAERPHSVQYDEPKFRSATNLSMAVGQDDSTRRYKPSPKKNASLNRAASMQLRAYKNKSTVARYASLSDDWPTEQPTKSHDKGRRYSWSNEKLSFQSCDRCNEKHISKVAKLTFDEFHDEFFHTQWPSRTIMICELKFKPSDKVVRFRVTGCNRFSTNENQDSRTHAEVYFSMFLREKVIPNLMGGDLEQLDINIWMNNSPCNQSSNKCAERIAEAFDHVQNLVEESSLTISFCHMTHLQKTDRNIIKNANLQGIVLLMSNPDIHVRQFTGYDWLELLMIRTAHPEKWLKLRNGDLRDLITERYEKDDKNRQSLKDMIFEYRSAMVQDIGHIKKALARINVI